MIPGAPNFSGLSSPSRREALKLLAAGLAAGLSGCRPADDIVPAVDNPEGRIAGAPLQFATSLPLGGYGRGVLATSVDGRPIKISGNPLHSGSQGATDVFAEADILGLYDPDRSRTPFRGDLPSSFESFLAELRPRLDALRARRGEGLALLTGRVTSPTLIRQIAALREGPFPRLAWHRYEPVHDDAARAGARLAFGRRLDPVLHLDRADVVLSLSADILGHGPAQVRNAQGFARRRTVRDGSRSMLRLFVVESAGTLTGAMADHRRVMPPDALAAFGHDLTSAIEGKGEGETFVQTVAAELRAAGPRALVLVGDEQPAELHALGHALNARLGAFGTTLDLIEPVDPVEEDHEASLAALADALRGGAVDTLAMLGTNPAFDAPADLDFAGAIGKAAFSVHLGLYADETASASTWHLAETHPLEAWSDLRGTDGTAGIVQPLILPLHASVTAHELLAVLGGAEDAKPYDLVRATWRGSRSDAEFEPWWRETVEAGIVAGSAVPALAPPRQPPLPARPAPRPSALTLLLRPDPAVYDGRYANNAWLQECPRPFTHETWGNALRLSPAEAARRGLAEGDAVRIAAGGRNLEAPLILDPRQAEGVAVLTLGYGRRRVGAIGLGLGANAFALRSGGTPWSIPDAMLEKVGTSDPMPRTQLTLSEEGRDLAPEVDLADLPGRSPGAEPETFYPRQPHEAPYDGAEPAWAMVIDTTLCIGCNACIVACQAENNVPVVGPDEIRNGRTMHWLRIDAYEKRVEDEALRPVFQPVPCMHCEKAPCEPVCPVGASVHDGEGLNVQVYNRCVGTRFCQANCPYKVRRFNFFGYGDGQEYANLGREPAQARLNPDVSVRGRGVMEKCTYCVQRLSAARRGAEREGRPMRDGEATTACASACPTRAITFGDLGADGSAVAALRREPQHHVLLEEVGTKPRTTYLAKVRNPSPALRGEPT